MSGLLLEKTALVTGATSGIGRAVTTNLVAAGARVIGLGRNVKALELMERELAPNFEALRCDLCSAGERHRVVRLLERRTPPVDILINNAAECVFESPLALASERLARIFELNVFASIELARAAAARMPKGGHVVQVSSVTTRHVANARFAPYASTKVAVEQLTEALRWELHPRGIHVSTVLPGLVDTPIYENLEGFEATLEKLHQQVPNWLAPADVAEVILWVLLQPSHMVVAEVVVLPTAQAR